MASEEAIKLSQEIFLLPISEREAAIERALSAARAEGRREGLEEAAKVADDRSSQCDDAADIANQEGNDQTRRGLRSRASVCRSVAQGIRARAAYERILARMAALVSDVTGRPFFVPRMRDHETVLLRKDFLPRWWLAMWEERREWFRR